MPTWLVGGASIIFLAELALAAALLAAGVFSSYDINTPGIEVLLICPNCANYVGLDRFNPSLQQVHNVATNTWYMQSVVTSSTYSRHCYNATSFEICNKFTVPRIRCDTIRASDCHFANSTRIVRALELDTDPVKMNDGIGTNLSPTNQIKSRKTTSCSPTAQSPYVRIINGSERQAAVRESFPREQFASFEFEPQIGIQQNSNPIPEFDRKDGNGTIFVLLINDIIFNEPIDCPLFRFPQTSDSRSAR